MSRRTTTFIASISKHFGENFLFCSRSKSIVSPITLALRCNDLQLDAPGFTLQRSAQITSAARQDMHGNVEISFHEFKMFVCCVFVYVVVTSADGVIKNDVRQVE
jgi:hypothetical protein